MSKKDTELDPHAKVAASVARIEKQFGKGSIMRLGDAPKVDVEVIPTGIMSIDIATGIGGVPRGRIVELYGPESAGKTMLSLYVVAEAQRLGLEVAFVDAEHALDVSFATKLGVDTDKLLVSQPDGGEQALEIVDELVSGGGMGLIVVDSVAALVPQAELEGEMGDSHMGLHARLMSQALRKIIGKTSQNGTTVLFINQLRMKIGVMFGSPETTTGGRALAFYASMRMDVRSIGQKKDGEAVIGRRTRVKVAKNKLAAPFKTAELDLLFSDDDNVGFDKAGDLLELAVKCGLVEKGGSWFSYEGEKLGQGAQKAKVALMDHEEKIREDILLCLGHGKEKAE